MEVSFARPFVLPTADPPVLAPQGAERKTRDEERRASKRRMTATGRKKMEEMYHPASERTEFYSMADTAKPAQLFHPSADSEKVRSVIVLNRIRFYSTSFW